MRIVADTAAAYAAAGYLTIVDGIILPRFFLEPLRDRLRDKGQRVAYAVLRAPLAVCESRARERPRTPLAEPEVIERLWRDFADLGPMDPTRSTSAPRTPTRPPTCWPNGSETDHSRPEAEGLQSRMLKPDGSETTS
jgi:hypothetical protein